MGTLLKKLFKRLKKYITKMTGVKGAVPPVGTIAYDDICQSVFLSFLGVLIVTVTDFFFLVRQFDGDLVSSGMMSGAQAASAVLTFDAYKSHLAQPRNQIGGHVVCAFIGVSVRLFGEACYVPYWVQAPLSVSVSIAIMRMFKVTHPPGGATAVIAIIGGDAVWKLGFGYVLCSLGASVIGLIIGVLGNNLFDERQYPLYW